MAGVNKVILVGNLGRDPEIRTLESGVKVATFSLATSESFKDREGNRQDKTEWHNIVLWRGLAEIAERYLAKGNTIYVEGKLQTRSWDDKDGNKRYTTEIVGQNMTMLGGKREEGGGSSYAPSQSSSTTQAPQEASSIGEGMEPDDLPF